MLCGTANHPAEISIRPSPTGPPLAASNQFVPKTACRCLSAGDRLILFSAGLPEASTGRGEFFGNERLEQCVREHTEAPAHELVHGIINRVAKFESGA